MSSRYNVYHRAWDAHLVCWTLPVEQACCYKQVLEQVPDVEAHGVDASKELLEQAHATLKDRPNVHLEQATFRAGATGGLPYAPETFDLITSTNALHYVAE